MFGPLSESVFDYVFDFIHMSQFELSLDWKGGISNSPQKCIKLYPLLQEKLHVGLLGSKNHLCCFDTFAILSQPGHKWSLPSEILLWSFDYTDYRENRSDQLKSLQITRVLCEQWQ